MPIIKGQVLSETTIYTDGWKSYDGLVLGGSKHHRIQGREHEPHADSAGGSSRLTDRQSDGWPTRPAPGTGGPCAQLGSRFHDGSGGWQGGGVFASTRGVVIENLVFGKSYTLQVRAIGGSTGYSGWSDPQTRFVL